MTEPIWIEKHDALVLHERLIALERGPSGVRDEGLLESALARPRQIYAYDKNASLVRMSAAYIGGIVPNHPFIDGNERAGFLVGVLFLEINGLRFTASEEAAARAILSLAGGVPDDTSLADWIQANVRK